MELPLPIFSGLSEFYLPMRLLLLPLLLLPFSVSADVSVTLDREQGSISRVLEMTLEAEQSRPLPSPDFSALERDFTVLNNSKFSVSNFRNGKTYYNSRWSIRLRPRRTGELVIPAIRVGPERSRSLTYLVASQETAADQLPLFLETSVSPDLNYSRSAFILSVRLYFSEPLASAELTEPDIEGVHSERLGNQLSYQQDYRGQSYQVVEQRYALFPLTAGRFSVPAIRFSGTASDSSQPLSALSEPLEFEALPPPPESPAGTWLPATELRIEERWSAPPDHLRVGDTLNRTLVIEAHNIPADWLPAPHMASQQGISVHPQAPRVSQQSDTGTLVSRKEIEYRLLLTRTGQLSLPALEISWWDTVRDQRESSGLKEVTLDVAPFATTAPGETEAVTDSATTQPVQPPSAEQPREPQADGDQTWLAWLWAMIAFICAAGWSLTRARLKQQQTEIKTLQLQLAASTPQLKQRDYELEETSAFNRLSRACSINDPESTADELIQWARFSWPDQTIGDLGDVEIHAKDPTLTYLLRDLEHRLYGPPDDDEPWHGDLVLNQVTRLRRRLRNTRPPQQA